ncbi:hypothetical protein [Nocardia flavorosea]|uniref:Uncharacterized protein n=1 Tax=Nocardia flavorosea TaxID=53429 RepID=A0A846YBR3_9NOCA|nr:hypothetical protein [Nocardia flavorosea]NKY55211.1 hypothetical protein [Nocardia flavorosea]
MTMRPLACERCGTRVLVEKFSPVHTAVQWTSDARECPVISSLHLGIGDRERECEALHRSIDRAVREHELSESRIEPPRGEAIPRLH